jgi:hypothetical protein
VDGAGGAPNPGGGGGNPVYAFGAYGNSVVGVCVTFYCRGTADSYGYC